MRSTLSNSTRESIIYNYNRGIAIKDISEILRVPKGTIYSIIKIYRRETRVNALPRGGDRRSKLKDEDKERIRSFVDDDPTITLRKLVSRVCNELNKTISESTAQRCLKNLHYTFKRLIVVPERRNLSENITARREYATMFLNLISENNDEKIYFLDELGFSVTMRTRYGRAVIGSSPSLTVRQIRSRNISVCAIMSKNGILKFTVQNSAYTGITFKEFMGAAFDILEDRGLSNCTFIMDNAAIHRVGMVRELFEQRGHLLRFLPAYSPFLNPIENLFSKWKGIVKQANCNNEQELNYEISRASKLITPTDCDGYYRNMFRYISRALNNEIIND